MKTQLEKLITKISSSLELAFAVIILLVVVISFLTLLKDIIFYSEKWLWGNEFEDLLSRILELIIGLEFIKMLTRHTPESVVEVLLFATARQLIISHSNSLEILIGILSVLSIFIIRKFLFIHTDKSS